MLKILQVHNRYLSGLGGEDTALAEEYALLRRHGHAVEQLIVALRESDVKPGVGVVLNGLRAVWSAEGYRLTWHALQRHRPEIVHVHNTFPLLSPSVYWAARRFGVPVVQTLHNYRLTCANGLLLRDGAPCELCVGAPPLPALRYRCFKGSLMATSAVAAMQTFNRAIGSYSAQVDAYIALTAFAKSVMARAGLPEERIHVKPNCVDAGLRTPSPAARRKPQIVFVGRIAGAKGIDLLLSAWTALGERRHKLVVVGEGPERGALQSRFAENSTIEWRGALHRRDVLEEIGRSRFLVVASRWYEGLPMVLLEAYSFGTPVVVPWLGAFPELIDRGRLGISFEAASTAALRDALARALAMPLQEWSAMSAAAREEYGRRYTPEANYNQLLQIYGGAQSRFQSSSARRVV